MNNQDSKEEPKELEAQGSNSRMEKPDSKEEANELRAVDNRLSSIEKRFEGVAVKINALTYVRSVENAFQNQKEKYSQFLQNLKDFFEQRICSDELRRRIVLLFRGHEELLVGFNNYLAAYNERNAVNAERPVNIEDALNFVNKVKDRFGGESDKFQMFLHIMGSYRDRTANRTEIYYMAVRLFQDEYDLIEEFRKFCCVHN